MVSNDSGGQANAGGSHMNGRVPHVAGQTAQLQIIDDEKQFK